MILPTRSLDVAPRPQSRRRQRWLGRQEACVYALNVSKTSRLGCLAALLVLFVACSGSQPDAAKDGGGSDVTESAARDASADLGCGQNVDFLNDPNNCGGCGIRCCIAACTQGACFCDGVGVACCPTDQRGNDGCYIQNIPVDLATDSFHCGGCGIACPAGATCSNATCVSADGGPG
jgi:hypothetical protein